MNSANGTVNHTPLVPMNLGSNVIPTITNTIPRLIETKKDDLASPSDVKYPDVTILIPFNKNAKENNLQPVTPSP